MLLMFVDKCVYAVCHKPWNFSLAPWNALVRQSELKSMLFSFFEADVRTFETRVTASLA